ncbi:hypothetical protein [Pontiella agarivorans]|uniref:Uncharacterized protein n=1 Tax=Pontiella agarivorans TaxID=3038953 RepID=A0ABU5MXT1_9BACT|nr:hypothetical protein [Pontiella agarivorans]MDZ8119018.1 hypothetical protein [Pontiella agarivorans]
MKIILCLAVILGALSGCKTTAVCTAPKVSPGYYPIDPLPVQLALPDGYEPQKMNEAILAVLPDETMRLSVGSFTYSGGITYGPAGGSFSKGSYVVVLDYIKYTTLPVGIMEIEASTNAWLEAVEYGTDAPMSTGLFAGVGLRLTANLSVLESNVDLGSLFAIGAAAEAKKVSGSMVIQTLGISGEPVSTMLPMPSEISQSSIQNAMLALGAIKAKLYEDDITISPRILGFNNTYCKTPEAIHYFTASLLNMPRPYPPINLVQEFAVQACYGDDDVALADDGESD